MEKIKTEIEICLGVGMNQIFPEITTVEIEVDPENNELIEESNN